MATTAKKVSVKKEKRLRRDTFWHYTDEQNGAYFGDIYDGKSEAYYIGLGDTKEDSKGRTKYCWRSTVRILTILLIRCALPKHIGYRLCGVPTLSLAFGNTPKRLKQ
jgi:hypothetical protein